MLKYELDSLPKPDQLSTEGRAIVIALLAIQQELKLIRLDYQPAVEINRHNVESMAAMKRQAASGILPGGIDVRDLGPGPRRV